MAVQAFIPVYQPTLAGNERRYVNECLDSTWISSKGEFIARFEECFARRIGAKHAMSVTNGTVGLHVALLAAGVKPGDEVIVPTFTYVASVNAIVYAGATPVFVDSCRDTWQMDPQEVARKVGPRTRAILVVHLYGQACEMDRLLQVARDKSLLVIEDCAESFGSYYRATHTGLFGDAAVFSFFGNKTVTCGEGGMVVSREETTHRRAVHIKSQGLAAGREYWHDILGYNYRMTNICAAIGLAQLEQADQFLARKRAIALRYEQALGDLGIETQREQPNTRHSFWMCSLLLKNPACRDGLRAHLRAANVETRPTFHPVHTMPMYAQLDGAFPVAVHLGRSGINLPSWPGLSNAQLDYILKTIREYVHAHPGIHTVDEGEHPALGNLRRVA